VGQQFWGEEILNRGNGDGFPFESASRFLGFDRDGKYGLEVPIAVKSMKITPVRTCYESPWQNGVAELWIESGRCDLLDHIIVDNERHWKRLPTRYFRYYHEDRTHLEMNKETPANRSISRGRGRLIALPQVAGLHHRYKPAT